VIDVVLSARDLEYSYKLS